MRRKAVEVSAEFVTQGVTTGAQIGPYRVLEGIPEGAKFVGTEWLPRRGVVVLVFEHESFPEVLEAGECEWLSVKLERLNP